MKRWVALICSCIVFHNTRGTQRPFRIAPGYGRELLRGGKDAAPRAKLLKAMVRLWPCPGREGVSGADGWVAFPQGVSLGWHVFSAEGWFKGVDLAPEGKGGAGGDGYSSSRAKRGCFVFLSSHFPSSKGFSSYSVFSNVLSSFIDPLCFSVVYSAFHFLSSP